MWSQSPYRIMSTGKSCWFQFTAACDFSHTLRTQGHTGIVVNHVCMDRGALSAPARPMHQQLAAQYDPDLNPELDADYEKFELMDGFVATGCALHDCSNALV